MEVDSPEWILVTLPDGSTRYETEPVEEVMPVSAFFPEYTEQDKFTISKLIANPSVQGIASNIPGDHFALNYDTPLPDEEKKFDDEDVLAVAKRVYGRFKDNQTYLTEDQQEAQNFLKSLQRGKVVDEEYPEIKFPDFKPDMTKIPKTVCLDLNERPKLKRDRTTEQDHLGKKVKLD